MTIRQRVFEHDGPGGPFEPVFVWDDAIAGPRPGVVVYPNIMGLKAFDIDRAEALARLGYAALAADVYGTGKRPTEREEASRLMAAAGKDRTILKGRILASLAALADQPETDAARTAAIGFCFGGKCVLDLARAGAPVTGVASFHGVYDAPPFPNADPIAAKILVLHGFDDPLATPEQTVALGHELTASKADWQIHAYGHTGHGFTAPGSPAPGIGYQPDADRRSWQALENFLAELWPG